MDPNAMIGAHGGATHINSMHDHNPHNRTCLADGPDIGAYIGAVAAAYQVQAQTWSNGTHDEESVMQLATSQPNIHQIMHQAPSTHSLAATAVSTATSPLPTMSPAKASPYDSPQSGHMQRQQHTNSPYANGHMNGHMNSHGRDVTKRHKSPAHRHSGNEARHMQKYATHSMQIPNHQFPTPPSQHSHGMASSENTPSHIPVVSYLEPFPTPSLESPRQWSSSSPQSADWLGSEGISSPPQLLQVIVSTNLQQSIYL